MQQYFPYLIVPAACAGMCLMARGGLRKAAAGLIKCVPGLGKVTNSETLAKAILILLAADILGALSVWSGGQNDTVSKGYVIRGAYGTGTEKETLDLKLDGEDHRIELDIDSRKLSKKEVAELLDEAADEAEKTAFGSQDPRHITTPLKLEKNFCEGKVTAEWVTSHPDVIDWEGNIGDVPEGGTDVMLHALLDCCGEKKEIALYLRVYPEELNDEEMLSRSVARIVSENNSSTDDRVYLPSEVGGKKAEWSDPGRNTGFTLVFMGVITAVFFIYAQIRKKEEAEEIRREEMLLDYPHIVSKVVLLNTAGLSMRKSFEKIRRDYYESIESGAKTRPGYDEIVRACAEMEHGVPEREAYINLGKRSGCAEYRTFSALLIENLTKGGDGITKLLSKEADRAFDERKKHASEQGEKAGTKLLMPMTLLLIIVMAILMVPALVAFL